MIRSEKFIRLNRFSKGLYFSLVSFFSVILFCAGCINIPNLISFWNAYDESMTSHFTLRASAVCANTSWVPCIDTNCTGTADGYREFVTKDRIAFDVDSDLAFVLKNNCELPPGFGVFTLASMGFLFTAMYVFMYFQNVKAKEMNTRPTSSHYSIQIMVSYEPDLVPSIAFVHHNLLWFILNIFKCCVLFRIPHRK